MLFYSYNLLGPLLTDPEPFDSTKRCKDVNPYFYRKIRDTFEGADDCYGDNKCEEGICRLSKSVYSSLLKIGNVLYFNIPGTKFYIFFKIIISDPPDDNYNDHCRDHDDCTEADYPYCNSKRICIGKECSGRLDCGPGMR